MFARIVSFLLFSLLLAPSAQAAAIPAAHADGFDYYLLATQWLPGWCRAGTGKSGAELDPAVCVATHAPLLFHGLWPENDDGSYPQNCAPVGALDVSRLAFANPFSGALRNARAFVDHEWAKHGTCSPYYLPGSEQGDAYAYYRGVNRYFADALSRFGGVRAPDLPPLAGAVAIRNAFVRSNPGVPGRALLLTCERSAEGRPVLSGFWLCVDKGLGARECPLSLRKYGCDDEAILTR